MRSSVGVPVSEAKTEVPIEPADSVRSVRLVRVVMWTATIGAGLLQALAARFYISGDGNSYLDVASAHPRGDFANAINAYCSPFYSWLIALVLGVFKTSGYWETTILHLLDFAGLLVALRAFAAFASSLGSASVASRSTAMALVFAAVLVTGAKTLKYAVSDAIAIPKQVNENWEAAQKLREFGAGPGDRVALIGVIAEQHLMRLAKVKAVAELRYRDEQEFWSGDASLQDSVFVAFAATGARIVVATRRAPVTAVKEGWIQIGNTNYYAHSLLAKP